MSAPRRLRLVLGDQLDPDGPQLAAFDGRSDRVVLIEAPGEATHVWSHRARIALFLSAMRHFANELQARGIDSIHVTLDDPRFGDAPGLIDRPARVLEDTGARQPGVVEPGDWRLARALQALCAGGGVALTVLPDSHFLCSRADFAVWARGRRELRQEFFHRWLR